MRTLQATDLSDPNAHTISGQINLSIPRKRALASRDFMRLMPYPAEDDRGMLYWIAEAAKEARVEAGRHQVHIAAEIGNGTNQSTIDRFEGHKSQPKNLDTTLRAYANDLEIDVRQLWARGLELWIASEKPEAEHAAAATQAVRAASKSTQSRTSRARRARGQ